MRRYRQSAIVQSPMVTQLPTYKRFRVGKILQMYYRVTNSSDMGIFFKCGFRYIIKELCLGVVDIHSSNSVLLTVTPTVSEMPLIAVATYNVMFLLSWPSRQIHCLNASIVGTICNELFRCFGTFEKCFTWLSWLTKLL